MNFFCKVECLISNRPFSFGADPHHNPDLRIFNAIFTHLLRDRGSCKNFAFFLQFAILHLMKMLTMIPYQVLKVCAIS